MNELNTVKNFHSMKENIKQLKKENKLKLKEKSDRFFKLYDNKEQTSPQVEEQYYNTLNNFCKRMPTSINNTHTTFFSNTSSNKNRKDIKSEGFYEKTLNRSNSFSNKFITTNYSDVDAEQLFNLYYIYSDGKFYSKLSSNEKKELLKTFNIERKLNKKEKKYIDDRIGFTKNDFGETMRSNKSLCTAKTYYFDNAHKAYKKIKLNKKIYDNMMHARTTKQIIEYNYMIEKDYERFIKVSQMPVVRVKNDNSETDENIIIQETTESKTNSKLISRYQLLDSFIEFHLSFIEDYSIIRPTARSMFTISLIDGFIYLFGGMGNNKLNDIWKCDIKKNFTWTRIKLKDNEEPLSRYGHTAVIYKNKIIYWGGSTANSILKLREDILIFDTEICKFDDTKKILNKKDIEWRRNHISVIIGNIMLVHGGIDDNDIILSDTWILDFSNYKWYKLETKGTYPPPMAYHCCSLVYDERLYLNWHIYKSMIDPAKQYEKKIKIDGLYIYGGMDEHRNVLNEIRILKVGKRPCEWITPNYSGKPPPGRVNAKMNFYRELGILIIHGGRNDNELNIISNEFHIFDLERFIWIKVGTNNYPKERTEFDTVINGEKILILGGINVNQFIKMDICLLNLEVYNLKKIKKDIDNNKININENRKFTTESQFK